MSNYEIPSWAGKPPTGLHLDVTKEGKLIQKLMIDEKRCYLFGRNAQLNDFCIDHGSCSRVHAALVYHKHLSRAFLVDLGSTHGTYIGNMRLEGHKPTQLPVDSKFHFGASTRWYIIRERPQAGPRPIMDELEQSSKKEAGGGGQSGGGGGGGQVKAGGAKSGGLLGLPETETELDNLTEFNTAHNRRITMLGISEDNERNLKKRRTIRITFKEDEDVINPEDIDPTIGRFRNMIHTTVIPKKRPLEDGDGSLLLGNQNHHATSSSKSSSSTSPSAPKRSFTSPTKQGHGLYDGLDTHLPGPSGLFATSLSSKLGIPLPNPAPEVEMALPPVPVATSTSTAEAAEMAAGASAAAEQGAAGAHFPVEVEDPDEPKKKKYAKEAWPGRKPGPSLLG